MKHLTSYDVQKLHEQLVQMRTRLLGEIQAASANIKAAHEADEGRDGADALESTRLEELSHSEIEIDAKQLRAVEEAERRMSEGSYGVCIDCGQAISRERLLALPMAARCIACEERRQATEARRN